MSDAATSQIILFADATGAVQAVRAPAPGTDATTLTDGGPAGTTATIVPASGLPVRHEFQAAWRVSSTGAVTIDMPTARTLWSAILVARVAPVAAAVRVAWMNASITGNATAALAARLAELLAVGSTDLSGVTDEVALAATVPACITDPLPT